MKIQVILKHDENDDLPGRDVCPPNPEREGAIEVEVLMPDGRRVSAVAKPAAGIIQNVVAVSREVPRASESGIGVWRGFIGVEPADGDVIECLFEADNIDEAVRFARGYAAENFLPCVTWLEGYDRHLWSPIEIIVEDGRGTMRYLLAGDAVRPESGSYNPLGNIGLSEDMSLDEIVGIVGAAWKVPCRVTARAVPLVTKQSDEVSEEDADIELEEVAE